MMVHFCLPCIITWAITTALQIEFNVSESKSHVPILWLTVQKDLIFKFPVNPKLLAPTGVVRFATSGSP